MRGSLTLRGQCLVAAGVVAIVCGLALRERDLLRVGIGLLVLPPLSAVVTARSRFRLGCRRRLDPDRVAAGDTATVVLTVSNEARVPTGVVLLEDTVPHRLAGRPRAALDRLGSRGEVAVTYEVSATGRGRYPIGPLTLRLLDPFGLCELRRSFTSVDTLTVTPAVSVLSPVALPGARPGSESGAARAMATQGEDDATVREYRRGDDLRRIHWRSTARRGALTVRREEQPSHTRAAVLLDRRLLAHRDGSGASLEWTISAAGSVALDLARRRLAVRVVGDQGDLLADTAHVDEDFEGSLLDTLAGLERSAAAGLGAGCAALSSSGHRSGIVVAVGTVLTDDDVADLARARAGADVGLALLLDPARWRGRPGTVDQQVAHLALRRAGWRTAAVLPGTDIARAWSDVTTPGPTLDVPLVSAGGQEQR